MPASKGQQFLRLMLSLNLVSEQELRSLPNISDVQHAEPKVLAQTLLKAGLVTGWQMKQLSAGQRRFTLKCYRILDCIGSGKYGTVFQAKHLEHGYSVALKILDTKKIKDPWSYKRFQREVQVCAKLKHPNIVRAYDAGFSDFPFLAMEFIAGKDLQKWYNTAGNLPIDWSCSCIQQAAIGLQYASTKGIVHRDIKPSNIMISGDLIEKPVAKVLDFGFGRLGGESDNRLTLAGQIFGTIDYIAPEQAQETRDADIRADVFSLGCTLFKVLTGELPFGGNTSVEKLMCRSTRPPVQIRSLRPDVPQELQRILNKMMARRPEDRYQTPAELAEVLQPFSL